MRSINQNIVATAIEWSQSHALAVATLVRIEGSAPYPLGAQMLIADNGQFAGQITGGCAEQSIVEHALLALKNQRNETIRYGLNSRFFDIKLPCGSGIDVHFETHLTAQDFREWQTALSARQVVTHRFATDLGVFMKQYLPPMRVVIAGQGPIVNALVELLRWSQCEHLVLAQTEKVKDEYAALGIDTVLYRADSPAALNDALGSDPMTAVVSLFHEHDLELPLFTAALPKKFFYFGALGSRKTHQQRTQALIEQGMQAERVEQIHGPIGLNIGAVNPAQIAVSIVGELFMVWNRDIHSVHCSQLIESGAAIDAQAAVAGIRS